jgi:hypothetical protein
MTGMGSGYPLHLDFGSAAGYEYTIVGSDEKVSERAFTKPQPKATPGHIEYLPMRWWRMVPTTTCFSLIRLAAIFMSCSLPRKSHLVKWEAGSGAVVDLRSNRLAPSGWTSVDVTGLPIQAGLVRYDDVLSGAIRHALRFTTPHTRNACVWPATHRASSLTNPNLPAMGQRFRLRRAFDVSGFSPEIRVVLVALKEYGMILADNEGPWFISGVRDSRWSSKINSELRRLHGSDFEAVNSSLLMVTPDSAQARGIISR